MSLSNKNIDKLVQEALSIEAEEAKEAGALGFMARILVQATLPHSKVKGNEFVRRNGDFTLSMISPSDIGLPYGTIPRLLLAWLTTEAVKTKSREIILGDSMSDFMRELGLVPTGGRWGSITRLKSQTEKLFSSTVHCNYRTKEQSSGLNLVIAEKSQLWWEHQDPKQQSLWESTVTLNQTFYDQVIDRPVPIDMRALKALKGSPMALDIYTWLTYRMSYLSHSTEIPWESLKNQFGANYADTNRGVLDFKRNFLKHMKKIHVIYPEVNVGEGNYGLTLEPSKTHIRKLK